MNVFLGDYPVKFLGLESVGRRESTRAWRVATRVSRGQLEMLKNPSKALLDKGNNPPHKATRQLKDETSHLAPHQHRAPTWAHMVTRFKCGGVCLGTGVFHTLSDGLSSLHFINTWSDIARGLSVAVPPFIDRTLLRARDPPTPTFLHSEYSLPPKLLVPSSEAKRAPMTAMLKITPDQLSLLKAKSKHEGSTYEVLAAHVWRCACKARGLPDDQPTKLYVATDGRARLCPPLPSGYLGNVVFTATPMAESGDLQNEPLSNSAKRIHSTLARMDDKYLRSALDFLECQKDLSRLVRGPTYFASPNLNINSWTRLPLHEADFGWGRPVHMGPASILYEGTVYILPSPNKDRTLSLAVCLDGEHLPLFKKLLYDI
ncbi:unnamed protein product [Cuscuta campestris]|uniref:Shikimate O-hydroxycinnamoyltransferase n=1 Tax=Cuscuta campestris TaxID=132261 RepID=A0A484K5U2_9ASTE|nr:unnamed protein product [Cuscuta campestris]